MKAHPDISIVIPARDERPCLPTLLEEIDAVLASIGRSYEIIIVDDGSRDGTTELIADCARRMPSVRGLRLEPVSRMRGRGQSAAFAAGIAVARGDVIVTMDADGQNDPADIPILLEHLAAEGCGLVQGDRTLRRKEGPVRKCASWTGRMARRFMLGDRIRDTGCSLRAMRSEIARQLPLSYRGMHRFIPVTARDLGYTVREIPVNHRPRTAGRSHYGLLDRGLAGLADCCAVIWMRRRRCSVDAVPIPPTRLEACEDHAA